jgi:adenylate kinase family enzyme
MLIDGFPRDAARWASFKEVAKPIWEPSGKSVVVLLEVDREVAFERFVGRGRPGDVFERRFEEHSRLGPAVVEEMGRDGVMVFKVEKGCDVQEAVEKLAQFWAEDASNYTP